MSSSLTATKIKDTYGQLLHVDGGVTSTAKTVYDGDGTATALKVSTSGVVVETSSTSDALRITQTGAGNALVVEDSANPDSTPFVVDYRGFVTVGDVSARVGVYSNVSSFNVSGLTQGTSGVSLFDWANNSYTGPAFFTQKSKSGTIGTQGIVANGDRLFISTFSGSDGTAFIPAASIEVWVDGTPGTNDMPGRLVFSTTADGASSPTERMRIDNAGRVGIGGTPSAGRTLTVSSNLTGSSNTRAFFNNGIVQSDSTSQAFYNATVAQTAAASFTCANLSHYYANQGSFGAGSTVTSQYGFYAESTLTGATNNYGFYSNIASGTGRWNFYAAGTAANYMAGPLQAQNFASIGVASDLVSSAANLYTLSGTGGTLSSLLWRFVTGANDVSAGTERMRIDASGNVIHTAPTTAPTLSTNGTMVFNLTSNTNLRVSVRGSDGVTRTANITLA